MKSRTQVIAELGDVLGLCTGEWGFGFYGDGTVGERYG